MTRVILKDQHGKPVSVELARPHAGKPALPGPAIAYVFCVFMVLWGFCLGLLAGFLVWGT